MKIEIFDLWRNGNTVYYWTLYDGPADCSDKVSGYATSLEETVCKILEWRQRISNDYFDSIDNNESYGKTVGGEPTDGPEHGDPGRGDDRDPEQGPEH